MPRRLVTLVLQTASPVRFVLSKYVAALAAASLLLLGPLAALAVWRVVGGHLAAGETAVALLAHTLYLALVTAVALAAAA